MSFLPAETSITISEILPIQRTLRNRKISILESTIAVERQPSKKRKTFPISTNISIYEDIDSYPEASESEQYDLPSPAPKFPSKSRITVEIPSRKPLRPVNPNYSWPTDHYTTMARKENAIVTIKSHKKWQKNQPNDHTSKFSFFVY